MLWRARNALPSKNTTRMVFAYYQRQIPITTTSFRCRVRQYGPTTTAFLAMATVVIYRPFVTIMEAEQKNPAQQPQQQEHQQQPQHQQQHHGKTNVSCPSYGCPFLPQDVYYDPPIKDALASLRLLKRDQVTDNQHEFEPLQSSGRKDTATLTLIGYKGGPLHSQVNQDRAISIVPFHISSHETKKKKKRLWGKTSKEEVEEVQEGGDEEDAKLIAVFDGHANLGECVSQHAVTELPKRLHEKLLRQRRRDPTTISKILTETFIELDKTAPAEISGGCTASVLLQVGSKLYAANAGDSRSFVVVYRARSQTAHVVYITREDKPHLTEERARVERMGGQVYIPLRGTSRVLYTDPETGMQSGLAMSRSIGDWQVGALGVIPDPIVDVLDIPELVQAQLQGDCDLTTSQDGFDARCANSKDDVYIFAVSATDGLMDFATPELIAQTIAISMYDKDGPHLMTALEQLIYLAAAGWEHAKRGTYRDDIAIAVVQLRTPPAPPSQ